MECARRRPEATALIHRGRDVSYRDLDVAGERFAQRLAECGVGPGQFVPVVASRSVELVIGFLGVLKRGAAYAALDPRWPLSRLTRLIETLGAPVTVTCDSRLTDLVACVMPDLRPAAGPERPAPPPVGPISGQSPASIFFTSGTTGEPKGAISPHRGTVRLFQDCTFAEFGPSTVMPLASAVPWDALTFELWSVLLNGGCAVVVDEPYLLPGKLRELIRDHGVNTVSFTASLFNLFVDEDIASLDPLSQVFVGGERVSRPHLARLTERLPDLHLVHCYGPVESTLFASTHRIRPEDLDGGEGVPLGPPVPNTGLHVWNGERLCGPGEVGELLISGDGLAVGYLGDPDRTAQRFPVMTIRGARRRVYRSGDLAHWSPQGTLHFDGRTDRQVKIRGHRIEPAEIERTAATLSGVGECAAVPVPGDAGGYERLVLGYTGRGNTPADEADVLDLLRAELPAYLVPDMVIKLDAMPLNDNGKLDADALVDIAQKRRATDAVSGAGSDDDEFTTTVAEVMASVLRTPSIPPDVDFFARGGTSLDLGVVCTRLAAVLGVPVPISAAINRRTPRELAAWLGDTTGATAVAPPDAAVGGSVVPLTGMQESFLMRSVMHPDDIAGVCPLAWWVEGPLDENALSTALDDVHSRHEALQASYGFDDTRVDCPPVAVLRGPRAGGELEHMTAESEDEARSWLRTALLRPLDIGTGQVWRAHLIRVRDSARSLLGVAIHHIAFDGRSELVLAEDLSIAYGARLSGTRPVFPTAVPTLAETAALLGRLRQDPQAPAHRRYWRELLAGVPEARLPLPTSGTAGESYPGMVSRPSSATFQLDRSVDAAVRRLAREYAVTSFTVILAAYAEAIRVVTGRVDFGLGIPVSSRDGALLSRTISCLIDVICLRIRPSEESWGARIAKARSALQAGLARQSVSLSEVVRLVNPPPSDRDPLYQLMLTYQDTPQTVPTFPGCRTWSQKIPPAHVTSEVVTEFWPRADGSFDVDVTYQADRVHHSFAPDVMDAFRKVIHES